MVPAQGDKHGLLRTLWETRLWRVYVLLVMYCFGITIVAPQYPTLLTNFFARRHTHDHTDCQVFAPGTAPPACQNAHSEVLQWISWTAFFSNSVLSFASFPVIGDLSDRFGRKPFILVGLLLSSLPVLTVWAYVEGYISLLWYFPASAATAAVSPLAVFLSYVADLTPPRHRTAAFGLVIASFSIGFMTGPLLGASVSTTTALATCLGVLAASLTYAAAAVPETIHPSTGAVLVAPKPFHASMCAGLLRSWRVVTRNSLFMRLALCMAIVGLVSEGLQDVLIQYLQLTVGFTTPDQGALFVILGACSLLVQGVLLGLLVPLMGEQRLLLAGLVLSCVEQVMLAMVSSKHGAYMAVMIGSLAGVSWPAITAIKSNSSPPDQQGLVQGALAGVRALATGLGPLMFAQLFKLSTRTDARLGYHPGLAFWVSCSLTAVAAVVAATIDSRAGQHRVPDGLADGLPPTEGFDDEEALKLGGAGAEREDRQQEGQQDGLEEQVQQPAPYGVDAGDVRQPLLAPLGPQLG